MTSVFDAAGGAPAFLALATAFHARCLADPELNHPFSHPDGNPEHVPRLAAYWGEVLGGPPAFSQECGTQSTVQQMHCGNGDMTDLGRRFVACFSAAMDVAGLPAGVRPVLVDYIRWAVDDVLVYSAEGSQPPDGLAMPHWSWDGLVTS